VIPSFYRQLNNPCFNTILQIKECPFLSLLPCSLIIISWSLVCVSAFASSSFGECTNRTRPPGFNSSPPELGIPSDTTTSLKTYYHVVLAVLPKHVHILFQPRDFRENATCICYVFPRVFNLESPACCTDPCLLCT